ncbi:MAG TPA: hypothetical protein VG713_13350 [Pirellulales bacterium]|nr:hypothetical protein [Pirellulales bacterium]
MQDLRQGVVRVVTTTNLGTCARLGPRCDFTWPNDAERVIRTFC